MEGVLSEADFGSAIASSTDMKWDDDADWGDNAPHDVAPTATPKTKKKKRKASRSSTERKRQKAQLAAKHFDTSRYYASTSDQIRRRFIQTPTEDHEYALGIMIVDGWKGLLFDFRVAIESRAPHLTAQLQGRIKVMRKGGLKIPILPEDSVAWKEAIEAIAASKNICVSVKPQRHSRSNDDKSVIVYNLPNYDDKVIADLLMPPVKSFVRFSKDGRPLRTGKIVYSSKDTAVAVLELGYVEFDECLRMRVPSRGARSQPFARRARDRLLSVRMDRSVTSYAAGSVLNPIPRRCARRKML